MPRFFESIAIVALAAMATPAVAADRFDLVCTAGKERQRYRIDLAAGEYCFGMCERVMKIAQVTSGMITLYDDQPAPPLNITAYNQINRLTGEWRWYEHDPRYTSLQDLRGMCAPAEFTGLGTSSRRF